MRKNAKYLTRIESIAFAKDAYALGLKHGWEESANVAYSGIRKLTGNEFPDWLSKEHPNLLTPLMPQK